MVRDSDLILTATTEIRRKVLEDEPAAMRRAFTWREFALLCSASILMSAAVHDPKALVSWAASNRGLARGHDLDTPDPMGRSPQAHAEAVGLIHESVEQIVEAFAR